MAEEFKQRADGVTPLQTQDAERERSERELLDVKDALATELLAMSRLHELSTRFLAENESQPLLQEVLRAAVVIQRADFGTLQLYREDARALEIVAQQGFDDTFLKQFRFVDQDVGTSCGRALRARKAIIVEDVEADEEYAPLRLSAAVLGFRAQQSTPMLSRNGEVLGIITTYFRQPHRPSEWQLRVTDLYARQAAEMIERKRTEERLREYEKAVENLEEMIVVVDRDYRYRLANRAYLRFMGQEREQLMGQPVVDLLETKLWEEIVKPKLDEAFQGHSVKFESRYHSPTAGDTDLSIYYLPIEAAGRVNRVVCVLQDITERKRQDVTLRASEARFRSYFEAGLIGMAMMSPAKVLFEVNDELCRMLGYERHELISKSCAEMTHPDDLSADNERFSRILAGEIDGYTLDKRWIRKDAGIIHTILGVRCVRGADGAVDHVLGLVLDMTARKRAEEELRNAREELAHVTRFTTMGELAASIAHEVNQPLGAIVNNSNACLRLFKQPNTTQEIAAALSDIVTDATRASEIIHRIRALTRRTMPEKTSLAIKDIVADVEALARHALVEHRITLRIKLAKNLPRVSGDRVQLQQVLLNLVINAIEATSELDDSRRVLEITGERDGIDHKAAVVITVRDYGRGFESEAAERLFEPFYTTKPHGTGMGLRISRSIVEAHGGRLWARSNADWGASFCLALPAEERHD